MKFSHAWLRQYLDTQASPQVIAEKLIEIGLEVESLDDPNLRIQGFVYARVVTREKHPNADRLSLCAVDIGAAELVSVVCGAPNVKANMGVAFAGLGTIIPSTGEALKKGTIRGVESHGMICSARELLLGEESDGIMDLGLDHEPGTALAEIISGDVVYDIAITPNRGDCFSVYGISRDLVAAGLGELKKPDFITVAGQGTTPMVSVLTPLCTQFALRKISGVKNVESVASMRELLKNSGQKPISKLVDITNYFCLGLGRPMHIFDADKIKGSLVVRQARTGEVLKALDDRDYVLNEDMIVIADDTGVISLAGIMGGRDTAVNQHTTNVLLESAVFDQVAIAKTGQLLNLVSDSRQRFERGVDAAMVLPCLDLATQMITEHCGGVPAKVTMAGKQPEALQHIALSVQQVKRLLGLHVAVTEIVDILSRLGCVVEHGDPLKITPPTWRHDLTIPEDLIEEIARLKGYNAIDPQALPLMLAPTVITFETVARECLVNRGFLETLNWSFIDQATAKKFNHAEDELVFLANPIAQDLSVMRPSLVASLLRVANFNYANGRSRGMIFEAAPVYGKSLVNNQTACVAGLRFGNIHEKHWLGTTRVVDVFDAKADVQSVLKALGVLEGSTQVVSAAPSYYHPGRSGALKQGKLLLAYFGELHPLVTDGVHAVAFEIFSDNLPASKPRKTKCTLYDLMPLHRDFAFVLDASIAAEKLIKAVAKSSTLIRQVEVFDCYQGPHVSDEQKSLAISVTLQPFETTLDEQVLTQFHDAVVQAAAKIGATLRILPNADK